MKYYLLINKNNIIQDAISYPTDGYIEVEVDKPFPAGINGGWYKWENDTYVEIPERKPVDRDELVQRLMDVEMALAAIMGGAV